MTQQEFRTRWASLRDAAKFENDVIVVNARFIGPVAVLLGPSLWRQGAEIEPPATDPTSMGAREARKELKQIVDGTRANKHTFITEHTDLDSVVVPLGWAKRVLPDQLAGLEEAVAAASGAPRGSAGDRGAATAE